MCGFVNCSPIFFAFTIFVFGSAINTVSAKQVSYKSPAAESKGDAKSGPQSIGASPRKASEMNPASENSASQSSDDDQVTIGAIESARKSADESKLAYENAKRLAELGSVSQIELRRADLAFKLSMLDVIELENPDSSDKIALARANLELDVTTKELAVIATLYRRGSASELELQRAVAAHEIAELGLKAVEDGKGEKYYRFKMAQKNVELAQEIMLKAQRLMDASSISETVYEKVKSSLSDAEDELQLAKQELGVQVRQVPVKQGTPN